MIKIAGPAIFLIVAIQIHCLSAQELRQNRASPAKAIGNDDKIHHESYSCGPIEGLAKKVEVCAKPLTDILQGTLEKWPRSDNDIIDLCEMFVGSEKCIRETARKCAKGLHKIVISTLANSIQRARKRECTKQKYPALLKTTKCVETHQEIPRLIIANATSRLSVIENQITNLDQKTNAICCMMVEIENEMKRLLGSICPIEAATMVKLYKAVIEDVNQIICRSPKCDNLFKGYTIPSIRPVNVSGIISSLLRIVFSLGQ